MKKFLVMSVLMIFMVLSINFDFKSTKQQYYSFKNEIEEIRKFDNIPKGTIKRLIS